MEILEGNTMLSGLLLLVVSSLASFLFGTKKASALAIFDVAVRIAYMAVDFIAARTENKIDDKAALALKFVRDALAGQGQVVSPANEAKAKELFTAMHEEAKP